MQAPLPYHPPSAVKNQYSMEKIFFLPQMTEEDQAKWEVTSKILKEKLFWLILV